MIQLTDSQINFIAEAVARSSLSHSLKVDITDHFCCAVENEMANGSDFRSAFCKAFDLIAPNGLDELQIEMHHLLTCKHIDRMKKSLYLIGFMTSFGITTTILFKLMHWPGASVIHLVTVMLLIFGLLPLIFVHQYRKEGNRNRSNILKQLMGYIGFTLLAVGMTFKFMHWPTANMLVTLSVILLNLGYLPLLFFKMYQKSIT